MACLLLSAPPCLAPVPYILYFVCLLCSGSGAPRTPHTRLHGYPWHVLPQFLLFLFSQEHRVRPFVA